jgi:hypothetical protein
MRSISSGSSMLAITSSRPPQRAHRSISMPNVRLRRGAQFGATCFGVVRSGVRLLPFAPRSTGVIAARSAALPANTP